MSMICDPVARMTHAGSDSGHVQSESVLDIYTGAVMTHSLTLCFNLILYELEIVPRYRDPQLQVGKKYACVSNLGPNICNFY